MLSISDGAKLLLWARDGWNYCFPGRKPDLGRLLSSVHLGFSHSVRCLAFQMMQEWDQDHESASRLAVDVCTFAKEAMSELVGTSPLHCCMKTMATADAQKVGTWVRSTPQAGRTNKEDDVAHLVSENSVWSALLGKPDKSTVWQPGLTCFACNDLVAQKSKFCCDRAKWQNHYQSVLVFPMRYAKKLDETEMGRVGFLAFDSPKRYAFKGLPNIFEHSDNYSEYTHKLHQTPAFHLGALFADTLGTCLGAAFEAAQKRAALHKLKE